MSASINEVVSEFVNEVVSEVKEKRIKPRFAAKYKEYNAIVHFTLQQLVAAGLISDENTVAFYTESSLTSSAEDQTTHYDEFTANKKDHIKAVAKFVKDLNKPTKKAKAVKSEADPNKPKRGRSKKVVENVVSIEDNIILQLVEASNNTELIVIGQAQAPVEDNVIAIVQPATEKVTKPKQMKLAKNVVSDEDRVSAEENNLADKIEKKAAINTKKAVNNFVTEAEKAEKKAAAEAEKAEKKAAAEAEKAEKKAAAEAKKLQVPAAKASKSVKAVQPVVTVELVQDEITSLDDNEGDGIQIEQDGVIYVYDPSSGCVYNETGEEELTDMVFRDGAVVSR